MALFELTGNRLEATALGEPADASQRTTVLGAVHGQLVARRLEGPSGELVRPALGLLQGQDVDVLPLQEGDDAVDSGADGVDVPCCQAHTGRVPGPRRAPGSGRAGRRSSRP